MHESVASNHVVGIKLDNLSFSTLFPIHAGINLIRPISTTILFVTTQHALKHVFSSKLMMHIYIRKCNDTGEFIKAV